MKQPHSRFAIAFVIATAAWTAAAAEGPVAPAGGHSLSAFIGSYDANRDGVVTREEYDTVRKQRYAGADANHDGWLSEDEYVAEFEGRLKQQYAGRAPFKRNDTNGDGKVDKADGEKS